MLHLGTRVGKPLLLNVQIDHALARRLSAEVVGTAFLAAAVVGSGIAAQRLSPGNAGLELLENSIATGAVLVALILALGPVSGAHFNPIVSLADRLQGTRYEDWPVDDPAGLTIDAVRPIRDAIGERVRDLLRRLASE